MTVFKIMIRPHKRLEKKIYRKVNALGKIITLPLN